jgi:acyl-CoA synthetase (NDP forming)
MEESSMGIENLDKVFKPKSIAVIGASDKVGSRDR